VVSVVVPLMLAVLKYARGRGFDSRSKYIFMREPIWCFFSFISLYKQLVFDHTLRFGRAIRSKILSWYRSLGDFSQGIEGHHV
jgi:hypothetical protein